jgi:glycosyltransferase involved in cell wall biosynthesis
VNRDTYAHRILFLEPQPCARALKYGRGLKWALGSRVEIVFGYLYYTLNELYGRGDEVFDDLVKLRLDNLEDELVELIANVKPQVIHSHNAPDLLTLAALEATKGKLPVIHDCHEALSLRATGYYASDDDDIIRNVYPQQEKLANEGSDGRIYVTEGVRDYIQQRYQVDPSRDLVFHSYVSQSMVPTQLRSKLSAQDDAIHIVYIGTVTSIIPDSHYDLRAIFQAIAEQGIHVHLYVSIWGSRDTAYQDLAEASPYIHYHGHLDQQTLLQELPQYDYDWAGFNVNPKNRKHLDVALPNKVFEYIACGLPVLAFPHTTIQRFIERHHVGYVFKSLDNMETQLQHAEIEVIERIIEATRHRFTIENSIQTLIQYYTKIRTLFASN